jgi:hypothetical protein
VLDPKDPSTTIAPVVAQIDPPISSARGTPAHILAVVHASDYHVMDCPLNIHGIPIGLWPIGDRTKTTLPMTMKIMTSLNHTIHFHAHDGFRADELMYVEATSPWAKDGRAMINTRIFSRQGMLIATVVQEVSSILSFQVEPSYTDLYGRRSMSSKTPRNFEYGHCAHHWTIGSLDNHASYTVG